LKENFTGNVLEKFGLNQRTEGKYELKKDRAGEATWKCAAPANSQLLSSPQQPLETEALPHVSVFKYTIIYFNLASAASCFYFRSGKIK
jgi:hypothetical protein